MQIDQLVDKDLAASGLERSDLNVRLIANAEKAATSTPHSVEGYVIPYNSISGKTASFYRVRLFNYDPKYKQPKESKNHVYFPPDFMEVAKDKNYVILTEGEKKAALAVKRGYPAVALGGVDSWRNRIVTLPGDAELTPQGESRMVAKLGSGEEVSEDWMSPLAVGLQDLIDYLLAGERHLVICFDTDKDFSTNTSVQRAAAQLGFELRFRGVRFQNIRQMILPSVAKYTKVGLDDYLMEAPKQQFENLLQKVLDRPSAFPCHPNVRDYLNKRLQRTRISRKEMQAISGAILSELDAAGMRLRSLEEQRSYYFDASSHKLMRVSFTSNPNELTESEFGQFLYRKFGIGAADARLTQWLGTQFTGEEPVHEVSPHRVIARQSQKEDNVKVQLGDGAYAIVDADGLRIRSNGAEGTLFESGQVDPIDIDKLKAEWEKQSKQRLQNWWAQVLMDVRLQDKDQQRIATSLLFYISPWLNRWRGTQLPVEMTLGEAGSGKSTLQELRLTILTGQPTLRNAPKDLKDWHASITNSGGLHITDNLQLADKQLRQRLSDEICRIVTEPRPSVEMRKYYTHSDLVRLPVRCVFGVTAIQQPFLNSDILQRSFIIELDKAQDLIDGSLSYDMNWMSQQLQRFGGREAWMAHHLLVLHEFFKRVQQHWNFKYRAKHRLVNFEQSLCTIADIFGIPSTWIPNYLVQAAENAVSEVDWALEGIKAFADQKRMANNGQGSFFITQDLSNWALGMPEYEKCDPLVNARKLGKYMRTHKTMIATVAGIIEGGKTNNRQRYKVLSDKDRS